MLRVIFFSTAALLALPAAARADLPGAHPPGRSVAGVKLSWPSAATLSPGATVSVKVRSSHRRAKLALLRVDARGTPTRAIARRTLRSGTFRVKLPAEAGASYQLRAVVAGKRYWSWITTPAPPVSPAPALPAPAPPAPPGIPLTCDIAWPLEIELDPATVTPGAEFAYRVTSPADRRTRHLGGAWERMDGSGWVAYPDGVVDAATDTPVGRQGIERHATLPAGAAPGTYRLRETATFDEGCPDVTAIGPQIVVP